MATVTITVELPDTIDADEVRPYLERAVLAQGIGSWFGDAQREDVDFDRTQVRVTSEPSP